MLLWGILVFLAGVACYLFGVALGVPRALFKLDHLYDINQAIVRYRATGLTVVECPVTFHPRVGASKGGNVNNWRGLATSRCPSNQCGNRCW